jgi:hypothetical protein
MLKSKTKSVYSLTSTVFLLLALSISAYHHHDNQCADENVPRDLGLTSAQSEIGSNSFYEISDDFACLICNFSNDLNNLRINWSATLNTHINVAEKCQQQSSFYISLIILPIQSRAPPRFS